MRTPSFPLFVICTLILPAAAVAQISGYGGARPRPRPPSVVTVEVSPLHGIGWQLERIDDRIDAARKDRQISRGTARQLRREARLIGDMRDRLAADGLSESETQELENRALYLSDAVSAASARPRR